MLGLKLPVSGIGHFGDADVERSLEAHDALGLVGAAAGFAARAPHGECAGGNELQVESGARPDRRGYARGARLLRREQAKLDDSGDPRLRGDLGGEALKPLAPDLQRQFRGRE